MTVLPDNYTTTFNGIEVKWFIGDINHSRAEALGITVRWVGDLGKCKLEKSGAFWEAWGSCMDKAYQLFAWYNSETRELIDITPLARVEGQDYYYDDNIYKALTSK